MLNLFKQFTERLKGFSVLHYCEQLNKLGAETLEMRQLKLDLVMFCTALHERQSAIVAWHQTGR